MRYQICIPTVTNGSRRRWRVLRRVRSRSCGSLGPRRSRRSLPRSRILRTRSSAWSASVFQAPQRHRRDVILTQVWMAGAIDVPGNLEPACDSFRCAPYFFPHCTEDMGWCEVCDPEVSGHCTGFPVGARRRIFFVLASRRENYAIDASSARKNAGMERLRRPLRDGVPVHGDVVSHRDRAIGRL